jgi:hypothetical protein
MAGSVGLGGLDTSALDQLNTGGKLIALEIRDQLVVIRQESLRKEPGC